MANQIGLTFDCADPTKLAEFWKLALGYEDQPPPPPFKTREEWAASFGPADDDEGDGAWLHDPTGAGPTLSLLQVPEPKVAKNRLHIDIRVSKQGPPDQRWTLITDEVDQLIAAGATIVEQYPEHHITMADPEGNEFCVC
jgi:Glyoxalase-like domain